jgi:hypothetical protein
MKEVDVKKGEGGITCLELAFMSQLDSRKPLYRLLELIGTPLM